MYADAPDDPFLTYDPARSRLVLTSEDASLDDTAIQALEGGAADEVGGREMLQSAVGESLRLTDPLARGGLGDVWVGVQRSLDRVVAIKRLRSDRLEDAPAEQREQLEAMFRHEAFTTARLEHPNIVPVYTLGADPMGHALLAMKLVRGRPWDELLAEDRQLSMSEFLARHLPILIDVSQAAAYAHSQGVLHRDIKPQQVMVGEFGEVLLMDWGLAISFPGAVASWPPKQSPRSNGSSTAPGPAGTPSFMAPEQALGEMHQLGPWTDVYLLAASLYFLLTGTPPHLARTGMAAMARSASGKVDPPSERAPGSTIPLELEELVMVAMAADPQDRRPRTVPEFIEALQSYLSGATRRRRSQHLVKEVEAQLRGSRGSAYSELGHSLSQLREAETLWPENQRVAELQATVLTEYAEVALRRGDLSLARVQASQLPASRHRKELLRHIGAAQERRKLSKQQGGRFVGAFRGLIAFLAGGRERL